MVQGGGDNPKGHNNKCVNPAMLMTTPSFINKNKKEHFSFIEDFIVMDNFWNVIWDENVLKSEKNNLRGIVSIFFSILLTTKSW